MARNLATWGLALLLAAALPLSGSHSFAQDNDTDYESDYESDYNDAPTSVDDELDVSDDDEPVALQPTPDESPEPVAIATDEDPDDESDLEDGYYGEVAEDELAQQEAENEPAVATEVIRERYSNRRVKIEREVMQDAYGNYINHGQWKMWDEQGNLVAEGAYRNGERHGTWNRWHHRVNTKLLATVPYNQYQSPFVSQATFKDGQLHGTWTIIDAKQRKVSSWEFADGERHGKSQWLYANGRTMRDTTYVEDAVDGELLQWNVQGQLTTRDTYEHGRKLAPKVVQHRDGEKKNEGMYLFAKIVMKTADDWWNCSPALLTKVGKDEKHGTWNAWYQNGQLQTRGEFEHDLPVGDFTWWYSNGQKALQGTYSDGKQHGVWTWWHQNGQKATEGKYVDGVQSGRWTQWKQDGRVAQAAEHSPGSEVVTERPESSREATRRTQSNNPLRK